MTRRIAVCVVAACASWAVSAHDMGSMVTWNREISRLVFERCAPCHRPGGTAFSLMTYPEAQRRVVDIKDAVLTRRMPPWGAVKGFGSFRNDRALTQEQIELFVRWVESGARRGNNPLALPKEPVFAAAASFVPPPHAVPVSGETTLAAPLVLDGIWADVVPAGSSMRITAHLPNGGVEPLVWLEGYSQLNRHPFLLRKPLILPAGTTIVGVVPASRVLLIPAGSSG
jgi:hypothetical protein